MAQIQRHPYPPPPFVRGPDQRPPGPQLPPIQMPQVRSGYNDGSRNVQLPPMQVPPTDMTSPSRPTASRSSTMSIQQMLSSNPPSPPRQQARVPLQQTSYGATPSSHGVPPMEYRNQPPSYPKAPQHRLDQAPMAFRQPPPGYEKEQFARAQYQPPQVPVHPDHGTPRHYSPAMSGYSSPSYTHSEASPRSSLGPSTHSAFAQKPRVSQVPPLNYKLSIRQQPVAARACGFGERDRRVVDPPPIIELKITDRSGMPEQDNAMIALHCTLLSSDGLEDETELPPAHPDMRSTQRLMGTLVASGYQAKDENGVAGTFFVFPDLSCRSPGKYRLEFRLLRVDPMNMTPGVGHSSPGSIVTDVFSVYTAKDFPGMRASSGLLKALRRQGLNVGVKKGSEARKGKGKKKEASSSGGSSSEGEEESDDGSVSRDHNSPDGVSPKTKARKKGKRRKQNV